MIREYRLHDIERIPERKGRKVRNVHVGATQYLNTDSGEFVYFTLTERSTSVIVPGRVISEPYQIRQIQQVPFEGNELATCEAHNHSSAVNVETVDDPETKAEITEALEKYGKVVFW